VSHVYRCLSLGLISILSLFLGACGSSGGHGGGHAKSSSAGHAEPAEHADDAGDHHEDGADLAEVDLGDFTVTQRQVEQNGTLLIRFKIFGVVEHDKKEVFAKLLEDRKQRMRDSVITIVQGAEVDKLSDPSLGWLKAELIPAINKLLRTRLLKDVVFSDFAMLQS
jgi:flagellar basal body-associated protein FliL